jgi:hypothetical protein
MMAIFGNKLHTEHAVISQHHQPQSAAANNAMCGVKCAAAAGLPTHTAVMFSKEVAALAMHAVLVRIAAGGLAGCKGICMQQH